MSVFGKMYDFLIAPIREADQREGKQFVERYLEGPQQIWEETDQTIKDIPKLWSVTECPDDFLKFLKWIVGWTSQLDNVTRDLLFDELRRLISISGRLWKLRGTEDTIVDVMFFATGARNHYWNWFDFRYILPAIGPPEAVLYPGQLLFYVDAIVGGGRKVDSDANLFAEPLDLSHTDWTKTRLEDPTAASDPLGGSTAWKLIPNTENSSHYIYQTKTPDGSSPYCLSAIAEAGEYDWILLYIETGGFPGTPRCYFDLSNGVEGTAVGCDATGIFGIGDNRYLVWIKAFSDAAAATKIRIGVAEDDNDESFAGNGSDGLYVWNPHFEIGDSPSTPFTLEGYLRTVARIGTLARVTCLATGEYAEQQTTQEDFYGPGNIMKVPSTLGQGSTPSYDPDDYEVRLAYPRDTELGELREGRDPWVIDLPDPDEPGSEYESNLRIVDDGTLNRTLVLALMQDILRATGEKWEITYLSFLDRFVQDGDDTQWGFDSQFESEETWNHVVEDGYLELEANPGSLSTPQAWAIDDSSVNEQQMYYARVKTVGTATFGIYHYNPTSGHYYRLQIQVNGSGDAQLKLIRAAPSESTLVTLDLDPDDPVYPDVNYGYRLSVVTEGSDKRLQVHLDGTLVVDHLDTSPMSGGGKLGLSSLGITRFSEVEAIGLPAESDYVDING